MGGIAARMAQAGPAYLSAIAGAQCDRLLWLRDGGDRTRLSPYRFTAEPIKNGQSSPTVSLTQAAVAASAQHPPEFRLST
jgi:hypothetical protein